MKFYCEVKDKTFIYAVITLNYFTKLIHKLKIEKLE